MQRLKTLLLIFTLCSFSVLAVDFYSNVPAEAKSETLPAIKAGEPLPADLFVRLAKLVNPTVVNISTSSNPKPLNRQFRHRDPFFDLFEQFMNPYHSQPQQPVQSLGTGFIIRKDGLIITNNHVIQQADIIKVQLADNGKEAYEAEVIGTDKRTDIALIKIDADKDLPVAKLGTSKGLEVGEWVAAFGNPYGHDHTMTKGIISAIGREIDELNLFPFLQTDASINPGNSGGPLVNTRGEVIGVNTAIDARAQGIGFAIPIDNVKSILKELEEHGSIERGFIGVYMQDLDAMSAKDLGLKQTEGALVTQVMSDSPAEKAGLEPYDLIVKFNGTEVESTSDLANSVATVPVGKTAKMVVIRNGKKKTLNIKIGPHPDNQKQASNNRKKSYDGQKAPFDLGFKVADYSKELAEAFMIPPLKRSHPIIIDVERGSPASRFGLAPGDVILDVNRKVVGDAKDVLKSLRKGNNVLRVLKQDRVVLIYLRTK